MRFEKFMKAKLPAIKPCIYCGDISHEAAAPTSTCLNYLIRRSERFEIALKKIIEVQYPSGELVEIAESAIKRID